ncbi:MAG TPA: hypothetical protein VG889_11155 [Rhizomicrobium sp.]|nr:hypothetical protein [Rhizomicrobium sp.]
MRKEILVLAVLAASAGSAQAALTIANGPTSNVSCVAGVCTATATNAQLGAHQLKALLNARDVTVVAGSQANDIAVEATIHWTSSRGLTLDSRHSLRIDSTIDVAGPGALTLTTNDGAQGGTLSFGAHGNVHFWSTSNSLTVNGASYTLVDTIAALASAIAATPSGNYALAGAYDATPDGTYAAAPIPTTYTGTFEGLGNAIANLRIDTPEKRAGLFAMIGTGGAVEDLVLKAANVRSTVHRFPQVGALAAVSFGRIENVTVHAAVSATRFAHVGGIIGDGFGASIIGSSMQGIVRSDHGGEVGGLAGNMGGSPNTIANSHSSATIAGAVDSYAGGLVGVFTGLVTKSWASGAVSVKDEKNTGPIASAGGIVGYLVGFTTNNSMVLNCYASGAVSAGAGAAAGGLIGLYFDQAPTDGPIVSSYSTGTVSAGGFAGGAIGYRQQYLGTQNIYWDTDTSGVTDLSKGVGNHANDPGVTGLSDAQLKSGLPAGFSAAVWAQNPHYLGGLPFLIANLPE